MMRPHRNTRKAGFTLMELLVVCAIIVLVTAAVLANDNRLGGKVTLENLAYQIALTVRQAQQYGISQTRSTSGTFTAGFGVSFAIASPTSYVLFSDAAANNGVYQAGEAVAPSPYTISNGFSIVNLCVTPTLGSAEQCGLSRIDILYKRPNPDAYISQSGVPCIQGTVITQQNCMATARVQLKSPRGDLMSVVIMSSGQISLQNG